jgi:hypothetical protein
MTNTTAHSAIITVHRSVIGYVIACSDGGHWCPSNAYLVCFDAAAESDDMADYVRPEYYRCVR